MKPSTNQLFEMQYHNANVINLDEVKNGSDDWNFDENANADFQPREEKKVSHNLIGQMNTNTSLVNKTK